MYLTLSLPLLLLLPLQQSKDYDPAGDYIRHWLPELKNVPTARIHEPW
jgi:deoxyribodipyrimidine photo-lyase